MILLVCNRFADTEEEIPGVVSFDITVTEHGKLILDVELAAGCPAERVRSFFFCPLEQYSVHGRPEEPE